MVDRQGSISEEQSAMTSSAPSVVDGAPAWRRLAISMTIGTVGSAGMWSVVVVLPEVQAEFGVARGDASLPYTLTMLGFAAGNLVIGRFVDRFGIAAPLIVAALALGIGYALAATTTNIVHFALVQGLLIGTATAASFGPLIADVSHWFSRRRGLAVAAAASGNYFAGALWPPMAGASPISTSP
jgi:MFS family permease